MLVGRKDAAAVLSQGLVLSHLLAELWDLFFLRWRWFGVADLLLSPG